MTNNEEFLSVTYGICIFIGLLVMHLGIQKIFKAKKPWIISILLIAITSAVIAISIHFIPNLPGTFTLTFFLIAILFGFCFKFFANQCFFIGCYYVFHVIAFKGIVLGSMSLILKLNTFVVLKEPTYNMISIILTQVLLIITFIIYMKTMKTQQIRSFLINRKQMTYVLGCHIAIVLFMIFNTFSYYYNLDLVWISVSQIMISVIMYVIYIVVAEYGAHIAVLLQHKIRDQKQLDTIQVQLRQQNSTLKITEVVNLFKHDYREQMLTIEECIDNKQYKEAANVLKKDCLYQLDKLPHTKKYSNNIIINSLLIDYQDICDEKDIEMEAVVFYPRDLSISERELHEILQIISNNAIDANEKITERKRYLTVKTSVEKQWLNIQLENPYVGAILFDGDRPVSAYEEEDDEGMGLIYVEELLEKQGGIIRYENDTKNKIFRVHILIRIDG